MCRCYSFRAAGKTVSKRKELTRICSVFWKGKWYLAQYGQFDGYPEGQGIKIIKFLSVAHNIDKLKAGLEHVYEPTPEEIDAIWDECEAWDANREAQQPVPFERRMYGINQLYPSLARETSAGILAIIARAGRAEEEKEEKDGVKKEPQRIPVKLELEFANDTLFCEWAYVIDLDKEVLEVYGGGEDKHDGHRFVNVGPKEAAVPAFVGSFAFSEIYLMKSDQEFMDKVMELLEEQKAEREADSAMDGAVGDDEGENDEEAEEGGDDDDADENEEEVVVEGGAEVSRGMVRGIGMDH